MLPAFSFTKPYHTLHSSQKWNDRCYFSSFSNLTSPFGNYSCPVLLLFMWHFRPLLTTSILTEPYTVWLFEASQTQIFLGNFFDQIPSLFAPLLAAFPFILSIYFIIENPYYDSLFPSYRRNNQLPARMKATVFLIRNNPTLVISTLSFVSIQILTLKKNVYYNILF